MRKTEGRGLLVLLLMYAAASLVHFIHNAEFLGDYPGLPASWTRGGVYLAWFGMTLVGVCGWRLLRHGYERAGLLVTAGYALLGLDSLGHYVVGPFTAHTVAMNTTILMEVAAAMLVLGQVVRLVQQRVAQRGRFARRR
jgi:hypothetical protein